MSKMIEKKDNVEGEFDRRTAWFTKLCQAAKIGLPTVGICF